MENRPGMATQIWGICLKWPRGDEESRWQRELRVVQGAGAVADSFGGRVFAVPCRTLRLRGSGELRLVLTLGHARAVWQARASSSGAQARLDTRGFCFEEDGA